MARLSKMLVIDAAVRLADELGMDNLTIRRVADALDVKPMSLYHHVPNKEAMIDAMVDRVFGEIALPPADLPWRDAIEVRARSARDALRRHPWATPLLDARSNPGPSTLRHHDAVIGCFLEAGFSVEVIGRAVGVIDAFVYGFALQENVLPASSGAEVADLAADVIAPLDPAEYPHLVRFAKEQVQTGSFDFANGFDYGLALLLDAIEATAGAQQH